MCDDLCEWLRLLRDWLPDDMEPCLEDARALAMDLTEPRDEVYIERILECIEEQMKRQKQMHRVLGALTAAPMAAAPAPTSTPMPAPLPPPPPQEILDALIAREQTTQRTAAWYEQSSRVVTASEVSSLFGSPRARGQLVATKAQPYQPRNQSLAVTSDYMSAFDWGIRFEPCIKAIYEHRHDAVVKDLGRLVHPTDPRTSASPDGLVYLAADPARRGRLVEFKAPVTREILPGVIPKDYQMQMQLQLHVTRLHVCDFVEASFAAAYGTRPIVEGPGWYSGIIAVVQREQPQDGQCYYYVYSPVNPCPTWTPVREKEDDSVVELVPWRLMQWQEQVMVRSEEWWEALMGPLEQFWADVERYKRGEFTVPESSRPPKKRPAEVCNIVFQRLDENGAPMPSPPSPIGEACAIVL